MTNFVELDALLPYLDDIFDNLSSDDNDVEATEESHTISSTALKQAQGLVPYSTGLQRRKKEIN
ncbi:hypothetical protein P3T76_015262 [Phytophthora citrophthora]|uniref:Uncharacterized protein n=1 Tax=Phytophthora citrophthora TaxID=4793 RepID=A0AAD9FZZ0_9STRA|nr:hypothetical protein P3T76_015262 [Phytophthora citrophthora]